MIRAKGASRINKSSKDDKIDRWHSEEKGLVQPAGQSR